MCLLGTKLVFSTSCINKAHTSREKYGKQKTIPLKYMPLGHNNITSKASYIRNFNPSVIHIPTHTHKHIPITSLMPLILGKGSCKETEVAIGDSAG